MVRIRFPPAESHQRTELGEFRPREGGFPMVSSRDAAKSSIPGTGRSGAPHTKGQVDAEGDAIQIVTIGVPFEQCTLTLSM
jgi:hypothetical protein